jgi:hypothetical protein
MGESLFMTLVSLAECVGLATRCMCSPRRHPTPWFQAALRLTLAAAEDLRVPMPVASLLHDRFLTLMAYGGDSREIYGLAKQRPRSIGAED